MNPQKQENPSESFNLAEDTQKGFDDTNRLPERLNRYGFARKRALENLTQVDARIKLFSDSPNPFRFHLEKLRPRLAVCGDYLAFKDYYTVGKIRLSAANFCKAHLLCPLCAIRRGSKTLEAYLKRYEVIMSENSGLRMSMLTLTVKNGDDLEERFMHLKNSVAKVLERRRKTLAGARGWNSEFAKIAGLVGTYEVTKDNGFGEIKETGWHPHAHIMVLHSERFDYKALQAEWLKITGDSHVLNVTAAKHPKEPAIDFLEVFKYAVKFGDLTPEQNLDAYEVLRGKRLLFSAGLFWGVEIPESLEDDVLDLDQLPFFELIYQYIVGSGYNLITRQDFFKQDKREALKLINNKKTTT
jgi:hypothetical protein